jgi:hypothetical protein
MMTHDDDRICGYGYQRELSSSLPIIAHNCNAARDKIKAYYHQYVLIIMMMNNNLPASLAILNGF